MTIERDHACLPCQALPDLDHVGGGHVVPLCGRLLGGGVLLAGDLADVDHLLDDRLAPDVRRHHDRVVVPHRLLTRTLLLVAEVGYSFQSLIFYLHSLVSNPVELHLGNCVPCLPFVNQLRAPVQYVLYLKEKHLL